MFETIVSLFFSVITPAIMQWLKTNPWVPFINRGRPVFNTIFAALIAAGNVVGVTFLFSDGTLTISGLEIAEMARLGATFVLTWAAQELVYRVKVKP